MTADDRLKEALSLGTDAPPTADHAFTARVLERVERRRLWTRLLTSALWAAAAVLMGWVLRPVLQELGEALTPLAGIGMVSLMVGLGLWMARRGMLARAVRRLQPPPRPRRS